ncbi:hypothetical protein ACQKE4_11765, partial [Halomonas sp. NPDC076908]
DRSAYKTLSSVKAVCKSITITGMTGHVRRNTQFGNSPEFWLNAQQSVDLWNAAKSVKEEVDRIKPLHAA